VRLHGVTDEPVADLLARASAGINAAALAAAKPVPVNEAGVSETGEPGAPENTDTGVSLDAENTEPRALHAVPQTPALPAPQHPADDSGNGEISAARYTELLELAREVERWRGLPSASRISRELGIGMPLAAALANALSEEEQANAEEDDQRRMSAGRNLTPDQVAELIRAAGGERPGVREVMRTFNVAYTKAVAALALLDNAA
jgi:hypothetical protein